MLQTREKLSQLSQGRTIVVIGVGTFCTLNLRFLIEMCDDIAFFIDKDYEHRRYFEFTTGCKVFSYDHFDSHKHFALIFQTNFKVIDSIMSELTLRGATSYDYISLPELLDSDVEYRDMQIGKGSASYDVLISHREYISKVGRYCSINHSCKFVWDHNIDMITTAQTRFSPTPGGGICGKRASSDIRFARRQRLTIGNDVWIGANAVINASKCHNIGNGAIIGTGAIVIDDIPPYAIMVGVPAKVKRYRFSSAQIKIIEQTRWWDWGEKQFENNAACFSCPEQFFEKFKAITTRGGDGSEL